MFGLFCAGFMYFIFALMIRFGGIEAVNKLLPPVVIGPVIMVIGLSVAMVACQMAMGQAGGEQVIDYQKSLLLAGFTFLVTMIVTVFAKGMMRLVPILIGVAAGYALALAMVSFACAIAPPAAKASTARASKCFFMKTPK